MRILNSSKGTLLADRAQRAESFISRMIGLLNRKSIEKGEALVIPRCQAVHMFFMKFSIDVLFVNNMHQVVGAVPALKPFRFSIYYPSAICAIELPSGTIRETKTTMGDFIYIED